MHTMALLAKTPDQPHSVKELADVMQASKNTLSKALQRIGVSVGVPGGGLGVAVGVLVGLSVDVHEGVHVYVRVDVLVWGGIIEHIIFVIALNGIYCYPCIENRGSGFTIEELVECHIV